MEYIVVTGYLLALTYICAFSLGQLHLTYLYLKGKKIPTHPPLLPEEWPVVTVQLPVYNEKYVVERLIDCVASFDYPTDKLEIQVLDDSTDETTELIAERIKYWQARGVEIHLVRRPDRKGFKAGALQYGLERAKGQFIAIFDADFLPQKGFLKSTIPYFNNENTGVVQTRWGHINETFSLFTRLQAFGLNAHFSIEQSGRSQAGSFINFNGTAGVWRKHCIVDAGGWSDDTLTEDLDLSYRAQFRGWHFEYLEKVVSPAELPVLMSSIKSQQYRWNKGAAETARKNIKKLWRSSLPLTNKLHAFFHLFNSSIFLAVLLSALFSIPMLFVKAGNPTLNFLFDLGTVFLAGFFAIGFFYWVAVKNTLAPGFSGGWQSMGYYVRYFPLFLTVSMGLSLHNTIAVLEGLAGIRTPFIRTPKFNVSNKKDSLRKNIYVKNNLTMSTVTEGLLGLYFLFGVAAGFYLKDYGLLLFHLMLSGGFMTVFYQSIRKVNYAAG
ncbi:cellulose synthase family protein [Roseivirga sp. BDSF3-8]|uniref:cellulose synthase family protein n=1 Tax=Roseivirga sp. BDSF3-8 TaxID=3241598 RepID=UPI003531A038